MSTGTGSRHLLNPLGPLSSSSSSGQTPSQLDQVPPILERDLRAAGAILIQQLGVLLSLPQVVSSTACVLYQRFWFVTSLKHFSTNDIALAALLLSSKLEESPLRLRDLINSFSYLWWRIHHDAEGETETEYTPMDYFATEFYDLKDKIVIAEMQILKRLAFQTQTGLSYGHLINYLKVLGLSEHEDFVKMSWGFCNNFLQTPSPALYPQSTLALTSIYLTSRLLSSSSSSPPLPLTPTPWWELFDSTEQDLIDISTMVLELYRDWQQGVREEGDLGEGAGGGVWKKIRELPEGKEGVRRVIQRVAERDRSEREGGGGLMVEGRGD